MNAVGSAEKAEAPAAEHLVEREAELDTLTDLIHELEHGRGGGSALVVGPPGSGRTALLGRAAAVAARRQVQVYTARGSATEAELPYGVLSQLLAGAPDLVDVPWLPAVLENDADVPMLHELLRRRVLESARRCPVLLVVDDLLLADEESATWLAGLQRRRGQAPVLILAAHAGMPDADDDPGSLCPAGLRGENRRLLRLRPLSPAAVARMVHAIPGPRVPAGELHAMTQGNPALLTEVLARSAARPGSGAGIGVITTDVRRQRVLGLLARLPADLAALVRMIAAVGTLDEASLRSLAGPIGMPIGRALRVLSDLGLIGAGPAEPMDPDVVTWVLAVTGPHERARIRRDAADLGHRRAAPEEEVAELLVGSEPVGQAWALETLDAAARRRREAGDHAGAARFYRRALAEPATDGTLARLRLDLEMVEASSCPFTADLRLARAIPVAVDGDSVRTRLSVVDLMLLRGTREQALRELAGLSVAPLGEDERADLIALHWLAEGTGRGASTLGVPAVADVDPASMSPAQAAAAAWLTMMAGRDSRAARRLARRAGETWHTRTPLYAPWLALAATFGHTDDVLEALSVYDALVAAGTVAGARVPVLLALTGRAWIDLQRGRVRAAQEALADASAAVPPDGRPPTAAGALSMIAIAAALTRGDLDAAQRAAGAVTGGGSGGGATTPFVLFMRGMLELDLKRHRRALGMFQECGRRMQALGWANPAVVPWRSHVAIAAQALGDEHTAAAMISEEWRLAQAWGTRTAIGRTHLGAGVAVRSEDAVFRLTQAVNALQQSPSRVLYVEALLLLAAAQLNRGQTTGVARQLREAERLATAYRLDWATTRIADLRSRLSDRPRPRSTYRTASRRWRSLAPGATDLVRRVLAGAANAQLASELGISKRAVELRLTTIYRQLEVTGRTELRELYAALDKEL
ncbi:AAA family ATPase [Amycolatopsis jiangsuensis]|uniref:DNA-binding NarL/FixJ family response regulator n=1 Tax=Amycolatopsis jiangsuensis TaxID=1181879 RepID=A0A840IQI8_9PSEU|nr:AAA family ATPase [Amycolatopsis jiangsuensis]MBB4683809.1 DNA-binding NarL/FixJ family response regulator [Amycolatopsis jiangsuensis]